MKTNLDELLKKQAELKAMKESCDQYEKLLSKEIEGFLKDYIGLSMDKQISLLDIVAASLKAKVFYDKKEDGKE